MTPIFHLAPDLRGGVSVEFVATMPQVLLFDLEEAMEPWQQIGGGWNSLAHAIRVNLEGWLRARIQDGTLWFDRIRQQWRYSL